MTGSLLQTVFPRRRVTGSRLSQDSAERFDAMAAGDLALACSGTVTSELAMQDTPMLVGYRVGALTWALARHLLYKPAAYHDYEYRQPTTRKLFRNSFSHACAPT